MKPSHLSSTSLVTIDLDGKQYLAQVREKQRDFIKNRLVHVDFQLYLLFNLTHHPLPKYIFVQIIFGLEVCMGEDDHIFF